MEFGIVIRSGLHFPLLTFSHAERISQFWDVPKMDAVLILLATNTNGKS